MSDLSAVPPAVPTPQDLQATNLQGTPLHTLPTLLTMLASLHATRGPLAASLDIIDKEIERCMVLAHQTMSSAGARHFATADALLELKPKRVYKPVDWNQIHGHVRLTGEFDILQRRLSITALNQRRQDELPAGIEALTFDEPKFSLVKVRA